MTLVSNAIMIGAATLCFGGSIRFRRPLAVVAALIMLASMLDLVTLHILPPLAWTAFLMLGGMMLGFDLRCSESASKNCSASNAVPDTLHRNTMLAAALAYPATAWLVATHSHHRPAATTNSPAGHPHLGAGILSFMPPLAVWGLVVALAILAIIAVYTRRGWLGVESGGMLAMLTTMLIGK